jgi:hypothetical protein
MGTSGVLFEDFFWLGDLRIYMELHRRLFLLLRLRVECGLLDLFDDFPFATNNVREQRQRWRAVDTVGALHCSMFLLIARF